MSGIWLKDIPLRVNPDLQEERDRGSFNVTALTYIIDGGVDVTQKRKQIENIIFSDPNFRTFNAKRVFGTRDEFFESSVLKSTKLSKLRRQYKWSNEEFDLVTKMVNFNNAFGVHDMLFVSALERLASDEQNSRWLPAAKHYQIIGGYAQTELGHGTYLQELETTATYDAQREELILNTPTISAMKWWPGAIGKSCNHAIVLATLIIRGKKYGMHAFLVQLRNLHNHKPLLGIKLGMVGEIMGRIGADNGYLVMDNVRIPRTNMLMRNAQVSPSVKFTSKAPSKANYGTMVLLRVRICNWSSYFLSKGITIAIRYSAVRRQSKINPMEKEPKILEFQTQQYKIFPGLAMAFAFLFASRSLHSKYQTALKEFQAGNFKSLPELHCESAGMKAFCTENATRELEIMRQSCGGHGYLNASGLAVIVNVAKAFVTAEGENTVMYLQAGRHLLKRFSAVLSEQTSDGFTAYLSTRHDNYACPITSKTNCNNLQYFCQVYQHRAYIMIEAAAKLVQTDIGNGIAEHHAFNKHQVRLVKAVKAHCYYSTVKDFVEVVNTLNASPEILNVMRTLCCFFATHGIAEYSGEFLESGAIKVDQLQWLKSTHVELLEDIRPNAVSLVDAFDHHDITLSSTIGCYDGNAYKRLLMSAEDDPLNSAEVHPSYLQYMKPFMEEMKSNL